MNTRFLAVLVGLAVGTTTAAAAATGHPIRAHGQTIRLVGHTNQSNNWFGYSQGTLEQGGKMFNSIGGGWTVPKATQHSSGRAESSSDWIGIGGGCVDSACTVGDGTLIQTGTEQDVDATGHASYSAWWEIIPGPSVTITMTVAPGDHVRASIVETPAGSNLWTISLRDVTRNETFTQTVPYSSSRLTAEWIEEAPLVLGTSAGFAALPKLTNPVFDLATANGAPANLQASERVQLIDPNGKAIGTASAPDSDRDGFSACTWATSCAALSSS